ncbi:MAG: nucleotide sugar dehydrogenase [Chlamydiales bacterium]|nr:nucleotide sugar dehydrogenase [Chlamydiales bacterium]
MDKSARICVVGLGHVGLTLAVTFANAGFHVVGLDNDTNKVKAINDGISNSEDVTSSSLQNLEAKGYLSAASTFAKIKDCDVVIICVPTPLDDKKEPDLSYITSAAEQIATFAHNDMLIVLESTVYPGTTREIVVPIFSKKNLNIDRDIWICFSPERIDPGRHDWTSFNTPKIIGGITPKCLELGKTLYSAAFKTVICVSSVEAAEMTKILENSFRAVNIAFINEMMKHCDLLGLDIWELINAASTKPFGFMKFDPGPGVGGHCIPIDPLYLSWKIHQFNCDTEFISLAHKINSQMPSYWVSKAERKLKELGKSLAKSRILILGMAYKRDVSDYRESPPLEIARLLLEQGALVEYYDPFIPSVTVQETLLRSALDLDSSIKQANCIIIATAHTCFNTIDFQALSCPVINCRGPQITHK